MDFCLAQNNEIYIYIYGPRNNMKTGQKCIV